jgi:hypothetical protein
LSVKQAILKRSLLSARLALSRADRSVFGYLDTDTRGERAHRFREI